MSSGSGSVGQGDPTQFLGESPQFLDFPLSIDSNEAEQAADESLDPTQFFDFTAGDPATTQFDPTATQFDPTATQFYDFSQDYPSVETPLPASGTATRLPPAETEAVDPLLRYREESSQESMLPHERAQAPERLLPPERAQTPESAQPRKEFSLGLWIKLAVVVVLVVVISVLGRIFVVETFVITSNSLSPTLESGNRILVNKLAYTFGDVGRGDLVVFDRPVTDPTVSKDDLIKRVVALENETIQFIGGAVYIGEQLLVEPYLNDGQETRLIPDGRLFEACVNQTTAEVCQIAPGHVYVLGDNRNSSFDSRFFGPISEDLIVGRADFRIWPLGDFGFL